MDNDTKLKLLEELDSTTDWQAVILEQRNAEKRGDTTKPKMANAIKLTKSEKKRLKLEKQRQEVEAALKKKNVETIVFNNPDSTLMSKTERTSSRSGITNPTVGDDEATGVNIDLNKARHEIVKFGMQSLTGKGLEDAEEALAIRLGAQPKKKPHINYKELKAQRQKEKEEAKEREQTMMKPKLKYNLKRKPGQGKFAKKDSRKGGGGREARRNPSKPGRRKRNQ